MRSKWRRLIVSTPRSRATEVAASQRLSSERDSGEPVVISSWQVTQVSLDLLRQQVRGWWSHQRVCVCLPRLKRFLCSRHRPREHQETTVRAWLLSRMALPPVSAMAVP